jgi:hypothetical protein
LSNNFVYFNDDLFLLRPVKPDDWFINDKAVAYGKWRNICFDRFISFIKPKVNGVKPFGYKDSILNAARVAGMKGSYFLMTHTPQAQKKNILADFFERNKAIVEQNISKKFRERSQFNPQSLFYMLSLKNGNSILNKENKLLFIKPVNRSKSYIEKKIKSFEKNKKLVFCCIESLDLAPKSDRDKIFTWLSSVLNIKTE